MSKRTFIAIAAAATIGAAGYYYLSGAGATAAPRVSTDAISRGDVVQTVTATGTLEAVNSVAVGTQVSGTVLWLGADFNSIVAKGQIIAKLEPSLLAAQAEQSRAGLVKAEADLKQRQVSLADARRAYDRAQQLSAKQLLAETDLEAARSNVSAAQASLTSAEASVTQAKASLNQTTVNLGHTVIRAPIDGIVIQRSVDVGQTVAASLSSPTLFLIAADLTQMRVNAAIDEGDISRIASGQPVTVTVGAYSGERFSGTVAQVRLQPSVVSNVTTYSTIIDVPNGEMKLKPGMTASVVVETARRSDALRVRNAALRFNPTAEIFAALGQEAPDRATQTAPAARGAGAATDAVRASFTRPEGAGAANGSGRARLWIFDNGRIESVPVRTGLADGTYTELLGADLDPGTTVVTSVVTTGATAATTPAARPNTSVFGGGGGRGGR